MTDIGVSCQKNTYDRGVGHLMSCSGNQQRDAGLCYNGCKSGYYGVGPVCWMACPAKLPVNCGASCADNTGDCAVSVVNQVTSPFITAGNIALVALTAGGAAGAEAGAGAAEAAADEGAEAASEAAAKAAEEASLKQSIMAALKTPVFSAAKELAIQSAVGGAISGAITAGMNAQAKAQLQAQVTAAVKQQLANQITPAQVNTVVSAVMAGTPSGSSFDYTSLDPTGIATIVTSYDLPLCSTVH